MNRMIALLVVCISFLSLSAEEKNIEMHKTAHNVEPRSIVYPSFTATHDENVLRIYPVVSIETCQITVSDPYGQMVFSETVSLLPGQPYIFTIDSTDKGMYRLEVECERTVYEGYFEMM